MSLVKDPNNIRLAMLGMVDGNGHPFSWSAITNGRYDQDEMARCGYPVIPQYLGAQPPAALGIPGARVTHVWCDNPADAPRVAKAAFIPNVVKDPRDVIGQVDAVIIATDIGHEHVARARPFIEAGVPVFIDKPLADNEADLQQFVRWRREDRQFLSTACMRYAKEYADCRARLSEVGELRLITMTMCKTWERYGIHALEGVYPFLTPGGWLSVTNSGTEQANVVHLRHSSGATVVLLVVADMYGAFGCLGAHGTKGSLTVRFQDTFHAFKSQLVAFIEFLRTGRPPVAFDETVETIKIIIAALRSRSEGGRTVLLSEINA
jgi:predicted dehydrogenase